MVSGTDSGICHRLQHFRGGLVRMQARFIDKLRFYGGVESVIILLLSAGADGIQVFKGFSEKSWLFREAQGYLGKAVDDSRKQHYF